MNTGLVMDPQTELSVQDVYLEVPLKLTPMQGMGRKQECMKKVP